MNKRGYLAIIITIILLILIIIGIIWIVKEGTPFEENFNKNNFNESVIIRNFSSTTVSIGTQIDVTLDISIINGETFYAIEEQIPDGWVVVNDNGGATTNPNRLAWVVLGSIPLKNTMVTYTVQAPSSTGDHIFEGVYQFEGFVGTTPIKGETTVTVT